MDFVTDLPQSTASGYTGILIIMDLLTKMAFYLPYQKDINSPGLARLFIEHVIRKSGVLDNIVTDRGTHLKSRFWIQVYSHLSTGHRLPTAFHAQTDRQTKRQTQMLEQYIWAFYNYQQNNWVELLILAEFTYNNAIHPSTRITPFLANYDYHPVVQFKAPK